MSRTEAFASQGKQGLLQEWTVHFRLAKMSVSVIYPRGPSGTIDPGLDPSSFLVVWSLYYSGMWISPRGGISLAICVQRSELGFSSLSDSWAPPRDFERLLSKEQLTLSS